MDFIETMYPMTPTVLEESHFWKCFRDAPFEFGANVLTISLIISLGFGGKNGRRNIVANMHSLEKSFLYALPVLGLCSSLCSIYFLVRKNFKEQHIYCYEWFLILSRLALWAIVTVCLACELLLIVLCKRALCFWLVAKPCLQIIFFWKVFFSLEIIDRFEGSLSIFLQIAFGICINVFRINPKSSWNRNSSSLGDVLLSHEERTCCRYLVGNFLRFWELLTFREINAVMDVGISKQLDFEDLLQLPSELSPSCCHTNLSICWEIEKSKPGIDPSLLRAICYAYGGPYLRLGLLKVVNDSLGFLGPLLLNRLIWFLQKGSGYFEGYTLAIALGLTSTLKSFLDTQYTFRLSKLKLQLRSSIMTIVYQKCLSMNLAERSKFSQGEIQTFMSIDADRTVNLCNSFHDVWSLPLQIGVALYLLYTQVKFAFVSGVAITVFLIPVNKWISKLIAHATDKMMKEKDERIRRAGELLTYIRILKMYCWEVQFAERLMQTRTNEIQHLSTRKYLDAWCVFFWAITPTLLSLFTFGVFTLTGHPLNAATVFTCISLFNTLISPLNSFPWVINGLIDAIISARRLCRFLSSSEGDSKKNHPYYNPLWKDDPHQHCSQFSKSDDSLHSLAILFREVDAVWSKSNSEEQIYVLNHITLDLPKGLFIAVIGEVGSGKSSLLNSILREMLLIHGSIILNGSIAYAPQVPWILSGTIRDNILFGKDYDVQRYTKVIHGCALDVDLSLMIGGDLAYIGEKGVNLSGGQQARVSLARALYHDCDIYLLDDIFSAIDVHVTSLILQNAILGPLMDQRTRVICTHNVQAISFADMIIIMDKGHVKWSGRFDDFSSTCTALKPSLKDSNVYSSETSQERTKEISSKESSPEDTQGGNYRTIVVDEPEFIEIEYRKEGGVEFSIYKSYASFCSWVVTIVICFSAILMQISRNGNDMWLAYWVDDNSSHTIKRHSTRHYLIVLCIFSSFNSLLTLGRAFSFSFGGIRAAMKVHAQLIARLVDAPVQFFDQTPSGRILNRFSSDMYTIDDSLPFILNILLANFLSLLGIAIVLSYAQISFLLLLFPFWHIYRKLQSYYRSTSRELRRLDSVSRSPIYASFTETLDGSSTIRAFNNEEFFMNIFTKNVALYQKTSYAELIASLWLSLRLQLLAAFLISFIAVTAVFGCSGKLPFSLGTPGMVGLSLSYAAPIVSLMSNFLTSFTETEKEMVSVERVIQYMDIPREELQGCQNVHSHWPIHGKIEFKHVTMRYKASLPPALKGVSLTISAGIQVGIIGRSGAGKSSIINALFRLSSLCEGHILVDGIDVANVPVRDLRSRLAVVPQSPFLFEGSLRENLDPSSKIDDSLIWKVLEKCHIKDKIDAAGGLDVHMEKAGMIFSVGQRQLICLARALLKSSKILCLDECTANVDLETSFMLHDTIAKECRGMTVITIAHRVSTVLGMDDVIILDHGILVEQGNPNILLQDASSRLSSFVRAAI